MVFVTSDPHGHRAELVAALGSGGFLDAQQSWSGGTRTLWVLGDLMDRGPEGMGVVDLLIRLQQEAAAVGGTVGVLLGNHEILALGMHRFGRRPGRSDRKALSWALSWERNGGSIDDQESLEPRHLNWLSSLPALVVWEGHLLMHSDTARYLEYGDDVDKINAAVADVLASDDLDRWWECMQRLSDRYAFSSRRGEEVAEQVMHTLGVRRMVHGHSFVADLQGISPTDVQGPLLYARDRVLALDGGIYAGGPCLVVDLDGWPADPPGPPTR